MFRWEANVDTNLEDNADDRFMFSWAMDVESTALAWWESSEDGLEWNMDVHFPRALLLSLLHFIGF